MNKIPSNLAVLPRAVAHSARPTPHPQSKFRAQLALWRILGLGALALAGAPRAQAQYTGETMPRISTGGADVVDYTKNYRLGPQDVLRVAVEEHAEYSDENVIVPPDGLIVLPTGYKAMVIGKTKMDVQEGFQKWLKEHRLRNPRVVVSIKSLRPASDGYVFVVGDVVAPGSVDIRKDFRLTQVLARVGGVKGRIDETEATLTRRSLKQVVPLDLLEAITRPLTKANPTVQGGDVITIRLIDPGLISINGDVHQPGLYQMRKAPKPGMNEIKLNPRLSDLLVVAGLNNGSAPVPATEGGANVQKTALEGGTNPGPIAQPNRAPAPAQSGAAIITEFTGFLVRRDAQGQEQKIPLQVQEALRNPGSAADVALRSGDFVSIEAIPPLDVYVNGLVNNSGKFKMARGAGVLEAITQAGGLSKPLEQISASIIRHKANQVIPVDLFKLANNNPPLEDDDIVQLDEPNIIKVLVTGAVTKPSGPDALRLPSGSKVLDALAKAGGIVQQTDPVAVSILRAQPNGRQMVLKVDPVALMQGADDQNARLQDGDLVTVTTLKKQVVYLSGAVNKPGSIELRPGEGLAELLADGNVSDTAALTRVTVQRQGQPIQVDAYSAMKAGQKLDFPLQDGDIVVVPQNENRVLVVEAVLKAGPVPIPEKHTLTLLDAITAAGGPQYGAKTQEVLLLRQTGDGKVEKRVIPYDQITKNANMAANVVLQNGDIVAVPQGKVSGGMLNRWMPYAGILATMGRAVGLPF